MFDRPLSEPQRLRRHKLAISDEGVTGIVKSKPGQPAQHRTDIGPATRMPLTVIVTVHLVIARGT